MKKFDVYALGNALVDIEYHVEPSQLVSMGIQKGIMTLIDEHQENHLINYLGDSHEKMACGGSAANTLIAIAQMGGQCHFSCRVAQDMTGQFFMQDLKKAGIDTDSDHKMDASGVSGKCLVFVTPDADRTMNTFLGVSAELDASFVSEQAIKQSEYIYLEGYLVTADNSRQAVLLAREYARQHSVKIALTLSDPSMMMYFREGMLEMIGDGVDLLFANEEEAFALCESQQLDAVVEKMKSYAKTFAITRGKHGAVLYDGTSVITVQPNPVTAIDTLGAGDMFAGAFLYGLTHAMDFQQAGDFASMASAEVVTKYGPRLRTQQTLKLLKEFKAGNY
ncbi:MAG: adenosine kinase [Gammaproteobacteria bacterium]|nr:adenosine kinase [Gammaproteobacteria bacterium]